MGTAIRSAKTYSDPRDAFANVGAFVDEVLVELAFMARDGVRPMRSGPMPLLTGAALCKAVMACVCFCGERSDCYAASHSACFMGCSHAGPGLSSGAGCLTGCAAACGSTGRNDSRAGNLAPRRTRKWRKLHLAGRRRQRDGRCADPDQLGCRPSVPGGAVARSD
jgi:hypothetical protein